MFKSITTILHSEELKGKIFKGGLVLTSGTIFENAARLVRNMVLARFLAPEYFGFMATIMAVVSTFEAFTEVGVRQAVIQNKRGDTKEFLNVTWWFSSLRGLLLFLVALWVAPLVCKFYGVDELLLPMQVAFVALLFNGTISPKVHVLEKELRYMRWVLLKQAPAVLGVTVALTTALFFRNVWPLVLGFTTEYATICLVSYIFCPFKPSLAMHRSSLRELLQFAKRMFGLPILAALFFQIDIFAIGKLLTMEQLGLYSLAQNLALVPTVAFSKIIRPLLLPAFSKMQEQRHDLTKLIAHAFHLVSLLGIPLVAFGVVFSAPILSLAFGEKYSAVSAPFSLLLIYGMIRVNATIPMQLFFALARPDLQRNLALLRFFVLVGLIYPAITTFGLVGAAFAVLFSMLIFFIMQLIWTNKILEQKTFIYVNSLACGLLPASFVLLPCLLLRANQVVDNIIGMSIGILLLLLVSGIAIKRFFSQHSMSNSFSLISSEKS